jgi:hypothetical protein
MIQPPRILTSVAIESGLFAFEHSRVILVVLVIVIVVCFGLFGKKGHGRK